MSGKIILLFFCILFTKISNGQQVAYSPEVLLGNRSLTYLHLVNYRFNDKLSVNNLTLFDSEYKTDVNNIYFIRSMVTYRFYQGFSVNAAIGMKNPGHFATLLLQYQYSKTDFFISYSAGSTYRKGFTLEQSLIINYTPKISKNLKAYFNLLAIANLNQEEYQRSLQQLRIGFVKNASTYGYGVNLDQFNNASKVLKNIGIFIKHKF